MSETKAEYRAISEPFESVAASQEAIRAFFDDVAELRKKHRISEASVVVEVNVLGRDGEDRRHISSHFYGDVAAHQLPMLARVYGAARQAHEDMLGECIAQGRRGGK